MRRLLWFDAMAGTSVGLAMFALAGILAPLFGYSLRFACALAAINFAYGCFALSLATRFPASTAAIRYLIAANAAWPLISVALMTALRDSATGLGLAYLAAEGVFVGGLAMAEAQALGRLTAASAAPPSPPAA